MQKAYSINKIDTKEKAYCLGFMCCDACINTNSIADISVCKRDEEVVDYISNVIDSEVYVDNTFNKKAGRFPRARTSKKIKDITSFIGGQKKEQRHLPITKDSFIRYVLLGAFDADGCITWGRRKDKNRVWQKIHFTSSYNILLTIQNILYKHIGISSSIKPKSNNKCFVLEFSNKRDVLKFLDYIYCDDFVVLHRKYQKQKALRLELDENGEGTKE